MKKENIYLLTAFLFSLAVCWATYCGSWMNLGVFGIYTGLPIILSSMIVDGVDDVFITPMIILVMSLFVFLPILLRSRFKSQSLFLGVQVVVFILFTVINFPFTMMICQ